MSGGASGLTVLALVFALWLGITYATHLRLERRLGRLTRERRGVDGYTELKRVVPELPDEYGNLIYRSLQDIVANGFPLLPDDNIWTTFEIDQGSLDDMIEQVLETANRVPVSPDSRASFKLETVRDLAVYLNACPSRT